VPGATLATWLDELERSRRIVRVRIAGAEQWSSVEDVGRLRDALGVPVAPGIPDAFSEPVADPLGDLVSRFARTHGPFATLDVATRFGLGQAVAHDALRRLAAAGRVTEGEFRPGSTGSEWCDTEVLRRLRRRSLAAARREVEPVEPAALGRFLPAWQHVGGKLRGTGGVQAVVEQLAGCVVPASALEPFIMRSRLLDYRPSMLDELTASGEVIWAGAGSLPGTDGWVSLHLAETAHLTLPDAAELDLDDRHQRVLDVLGAGGGYFFRQLADATGETDDQLLVTALWDLTWAGYLTNDTLAPLRAQLSGQGTHRPRRAAPRARLGRAALSRSSLARTGVPARSGPPTVAGRWSVTPARDTDPTRRAHAAAESLLERHGIVTRGAVTSERTPGGFAAAYKVLSAFEEAGRCRRGYFVAGLGAAQFGTSGAIDRLRSLTADGPGRNASERPATLVLAATDPANPYGAALPWPERAHDDTGGGHRPGRKAGAIVILVDGMLAFYVERGGRTLLTFTDDPLRIQPAADALALAVRDGALGRITVERADGEHILGSPLTASLEAAGFVMTPRGLRVRR
jgi:ATP-dependent Lhr-like helicase